VTDLVVAAIERLASAEERRNELLVTEATWRREAMERDHAATEQRWRQMTTLAPDSPEDLSGASRIAVERARQKIQEGYDAEHDAGHFDDLAEAAASYALATWYRVRGATMDNPPAFWPWGAESWKPTPGDRVRELEKAGALIAAAIDALLLEEAGQ
jgi:hypothetical protein